MPPSDRRLPSAEVWAPVAIVIGASLVGGWRLGEPTTFAFDEVHYVPQALGYLDGGLELNFEHPPVGKWLIAGGIWALGNDPVGWRAAALVVGTAGVLLTYLLARRLLDSVVWASVTALFLLGSGLHLVHTRTGMLDIFLSTFVLGATYAAIRHLDWQGSPADDGRLVSPWLWAAGVCAGLAIGTKWIAGTVLVALVIAVVASAPSRKRAVGAVALALGVVPLGVYAFSYARLWKTDPSLGTWLDNQFDMARYHFNYRLPQEYESPPWTWPFLVKPVLYARTIERTTVREVLALGNPVLWWSFLLSVPALVLAWWRHRDRTAAVVLLAWITLYLPWLVSPRPGFGFYLVPLAPFTALGVAWAGQHLVRHGGPARAAGIGLVVAVLAAAVVLYPLWTALPVPEAWERWVLLPAWR